VFKGVSVYMHGYVRQSSPVLVVESIGAVVHMYWFAKCALICMLTHAYTLLVAFFVQTLFPLLLSCAVGLGMSHAGYLLRDHVSATTFTIVGILCKVRRHGVLWLCVISNTHAHAHLWRFMSGAHVFHSCCVACVDSS